MKLWLLLFTPLFASAGDYESLYKTCQEQVRAGAYTSRYYSMACPEYFRMPDPYLFKCLNRLQDRTGNPAETLECRYFCQNNKNWGPWYDFEISLEKKEIFEQLRGLHKNDQCFIDICPDLSGEYESAGAAMKIQSSKGHIFRSYSFDGQAAIEATGARKFGATSYRAYCTDRSLTVERFDEAGKISSTVKFSALNKEGDLKEENGTQTRIWKKARF